jgi:hypothetical protein
MQRIAPVKQAVVVGNAKQLTDIFPSELTEPLGAQLSCLRVKSN